LEIPQAAIDEAASRSLTPDTMYCVQLVEETGISVVPGEGIGQVPGTYHFR